MRISDEMIEAILTGRTVPEVVAEAGAWGKNPVQASLDRDADTAGAARAALLKKSKLRPDHDPKPVLKDGKWIKPPKSKGMTFADKGVRYKKTSSHW